MSCADIQRSLSANDRRLTKGRKVRSHLRCCATCRAFQESIADRGVGLAAISPLPAVLSAKLLAGIFGSGGGPAGGLMIGAGAGAGAAQSFGVGTLAKVGVSAALVIGGGVAIERGVNEAGDASAEGGTPPIAGKASDDDGDVSGKNSDRLADRDGARGGSSGDGRNGTGGEAGSGGGRDGRGDGNGLHGSAAKGPNGGNALNGESALQGPKGSGIGSGVGGPGDGGETPPATTPVENEPNGNGPAKGQAIADSHDPGFPGNSASHSQKPDTPPGLEVPHVPPTPPAPKPPKGDDILDTSDKSGKSGE